MIKEALLFDHDGGVDDLLSLMLLLSMDQIEIKGISITPADCIADYATESTQKLLALFKQTNIPVAVGQYHGINAFPLEWRAGPMALNAFPMMINVDITTQQLVTGGSINLLAEQLEKAETPVKILLTGPCSNLVRTLHKFPDLGSKIKEVIWMGGAVDTAGNVVTYNHNSTAEWNVYWDPISAQQLFEMEVPVTLFPLDVTNVVPVNFEFLKALATQSDYDLSHLAGQFWATTLNTIPAYEYTYYMWDILATSYLGIPDAFQFEDIELSVSTTAPNAGQTFRAKGGGNWVRVAKTVDKEAFYQYILNQFNTNF